MQWRKVRKTQMGCCHRTTELSWLAVRLPPDGFGSTPMFDHLFLVKYAT